MKFQGGRVVLKTTLCARVRICWVFVPGLTPVFQSSMSPSNTGGVCLAGCHVAQTQSYHPVCMWGCLVKFQGVEVVLKTMLCARVLICWVFVPGLTPISQTSMSHSNIGGLSLAGRHVVAQTQGYHLVCIWASLVKFQGGWDCCKVWCVFAVLCICLCCLHASNDPLCW